MPNHDLRSADVPRINGARIAGARPGSPFLHQVAAVGAGPLTYRCEGLPEGLTIDPERGIISGRVETPGHYVVQMAVADRNGEAVRGFTIAVGDRLCLTPPMGWNSWYAYSEDVSEAAVRSVAEAMVHCGLTAHGWNYVCIDDCWQAERGGPHNALQPNERFSDMSRLCGDLHALGLKIGVYSTPWIGSYAGFLGGSAVDPDGRVPPAALPAPQRLQRGQVFGRYPGTHERGTDRVGPYWLFDADVRQWDDWGVDFVKVDWHPNDLATATRIAADLKRARRDIALSLSNNASIADADGISRLAQMWRTTGDVSDTWESIAAIARSQRDWLPYMSPGHWNDPDMLQVGPLGQPNMRGAGFRATRLTRSEQVFQMSLWCLLSAPLFLSCDVASMDAFTLGLLTNDEVIAIDQDPLGVPPRFRMLEDADLWRKELADGAICVGLFNRTESQITVEADAADFEVFAGDHVRDLWRGEALGPVADLRTVHVEAHGTVLLKIAPADNHGAG